MKLRKAILTLTGASALALTALGIGGGMRTESASAASKACGISGGIAMQYDLDWVFFLPRQKFFDFEGNSWTCGSNGNWIIRESYTGRLSYYPGQ